MERLAAKFGKPEDQAEFAGLADKLKQALQQQNFSTRTLTFTRATRNAATCWHCSLGWCRKTSATA